MELRDRRVLVTGGGRGIGRAIALAVAREGGRVALMARTRSQLEEVAAELGGEVEVCVADMAKGEEIEGAVGGLIEKWGGVDVLVNNAGVQGPIGMSHQVDVGAWVETVQVNLVGTFLCTRLVLPGMIERGYGKIVNVSGGGAVSPRPRFGAYSASKAGVARFSETLAAEVGEYGIDVNAVAPGGINTGMTDQMVAAGEAAGEEFEVARRQLETGGQDVEWVAALVVYLAGRRSDGLRGRLLSAVWDDWEHIDVEEVMGSEAYTVRRLKPGE